MFTARITVLNLWVLRSGGIGNTSLPQLRSHLNTTSYFMDWNFPKPEEDPWYKWAYDRKYGKGAFERDFLKKVDDAQTRSETKAPADFFEVSSPFKHHWNAQHNVGILERNGKYIGDCRRRKFREKIWIGVQERYPVACSFKPY